MWPNEVTRDIRQTGIINQLTYEKTAWMRQKDLPKGYSTGIGFGFVAREFDEGDAPVILKGSRIRLFENDSHAVSKLFERAIRMHKITFLATDLTSRNKYAAYRREAFYSFARRCQKKFSARYPRQRKRFDDLRFVSYLYGKELLLTDDECRKIQHLVDCADLIESSAKELAFLRCN